MEDYILENAIEIISSTEYFNVNKNLIKKFGINAAVIVAVLASKHKYWRQEGKLTNDGYFFITREEIEDLTGLSSHLQRVEMNKLVDSGILKLDKRGVPSKNYYKFDMSLLIKHSVNSLTCTSSPDERLGVNTINATNLDNNNLINNIDNNSSLEKKKDISMPYYKAPPKPRKRLEIEETIDDIIKYMNSVWNSDFKVNANGHRKLIRARLNEGYSLEDFKLVIDDRYLKWGANPVMFSSGSMSDTYLRPSTIFSQKMDNYLVEAKKSNKKYISNQNDIVSIAPSNERSDLVF